MNAEQQEALLAENQRLQQMVAQQQQIIHQRGEPLFIAVMDALGTLTQMASQGHPAALELLRRWRQNLAAAEAAADGITIVHLPNGHRG